MHEFFLELSELLMRAKQAQHQLSGIKCPASLPGINFADELSRIGADFGKLAVRIKQEAARIARDDANSRNPMPYHQPTADVLRARQESDL